MKRIYLLAFFIATFTATLAQEKPTLILPVGHVGGVYEAIFSPDYKFILTRDRFETPRVWNAETGYLLANLKGHNSRVYRMGYSNDGTKFFTAGSEDSTIIIWDTKTTTQLFKFKTNGKTIFCGSFNLAGDKFIGSANDSRIWSLKTGKLLHMLNVKEYVNKYNYETNAVAFNRKGNIVMVADYIDNGNRFYWDVETGKLLARTKRVKDTGVFELIESNVKDVSFLDISTSQWQFPLQFPQQDKGLQYDLNNNDLWITDSTKQQKKYLITSHSDYTNLFYFLPDSSLIAEPNNRLYAGVWDTKTMQMRKAIYYQGIARPNVQSGEKNSNIVFNNDRSFAVVLQEDNFKVFDANNQKQLTQFNQKAFPSKVKNAFFSEDNSMILTVTYTGSKPATLWETSSGRGIKTFAFDEKDIISHACFSKDNKWVALFGNKQSILIYDISTGQVVTSINKGFIEKSTDVFGGSFSPDKGLLFFLDNEAVFRLFDINSGKMLYELNREPGNYLTAAIFTPDSKQMILGTSTSINKVFDINSKKTIYSFIQIDSTDYFTQTPDGYYQATQGATKLLHYVTKDLKVITFDQLDIKYNRPDKVLETIGNKDALLILSYHKAWEKRIKKLGIDTTQFKEGYAVPETDFKNRNEIVYEQKKDKLSLKISGNDNTYKLDRFNVWVNEVPLFGLKGINIRNKKQTVFDTSLSIVLSQGKNLIETSVTNVNGTESYRLPLFVNYTPAIPKKEKIHFIGIGINQFNNPEYNLNWSVKDIRDLALKLKSKYPDIIIDTLFDKNVTIENILELKRKLLLLNEDDKVAVSYSGHGVLSKSLDYFLSTYSINFNTPQEKGLAYDDLERLLDSIKPRQKLMLIDACHSGEVDKEEVAKIESAKGELAKNGVAVKSTIKVVPKKNLGMANSFELMQSLFVNVGKGTGSTIISAAGGMQYAQERGDLKNGVFTYSLIEAFNNHQSLKVSQLKKIVGERVLQLTNGLQKPTSRNETNNYDWIIW